MVPGHTEVEAAAPRYWLKPFGTSRPRRSLPDRFTDRLPLDGFPVMTGPARPDSPPPLARGDRILCHAVGHVRLFAAALALTDPEFVPDSTWAPRWPWLLRARVVVWVPRISLGPRTPDVLPRRVIGRIQRGSLQVALSAGEYAEALSALRDAAPPRPGL